MPPARSSSGSVISRKPKADELDRRARRGLPAQIGTHHPQRNIAHQEVQGLHAWRRAEGIGPSLVAGATATTV